MARRPAPEVKRRRRAPDGASQGQILPSAQQGAMAPEADPAVTALRQAHALEDEDGHPVQDSGGVNGRRPIGPGNPPRPRGNRAETAPRPSVAEVERRIAEAQLWIAQRLPMLQIKENAGASWGVSNGQTLRRYLDVARERMVQELISDRQRHQAEQIFALNECARRAMAAGQFAAAVGAFRVIAEIGGLLRAPLKPPERR